MIKSRCGINCTKCRFEECAGCVNINEPFWGRCSVKECCEAKNLSHCGECEDFPCELLMSFSYDENEGDNGKRISNCRIWKNRDMLHGKKAVIFDMDGTLIDSVGIWNTVDRLLMNKLGSDEYTENELQKLRDEKLKEYSSYASPYLKYCEYLGIITNSAMSPEDIHTLRYDIADDYLKNIICYKPYADEVLRSLKEKNYLLAIASTTKRANLEIYTYHNKNIITHAPIDKTFDVVLAREDVETIKPDGEVFVKAAEMLGVSKEECIVIEDSLVGLMAAKDARMDCAVIYDKYSDEDSHILRRDSKYYFMDHSEIISVINHGDE
ncbi:MAG: HAD-IA family hydrolase [Eubacteriaceae bacterium]|nr:HAD-IA family hydrolase [Eubacteriaceae bacterium]